MNAPLPEGSDTQLLPTFRLSNPNNLCYINSSLYALWFAADAAQRPQVIPRVLQGSHGRHCALHVLRFQLLGWTQPQRQHDVAELVDFVHPRIATEEFREKLESRLDGSRGVECQIEGDGTKCIRLVRPSKHRPDIQTLIRFWHEQDRVYGLTEPVPWLFVQLPRFKVVQGSLRKTQQQYNHADIVQVPIFIDHTSLRVRWQAYSVVGYVRHHGSSVTSGHYTTLRVKGGIWWSTDDAKPPCMLTAEQLALVPRMIYLAVLVLPQPGSILHVAGSGDLASESHDSAPLRPQPGGAGLGGKSSPSSGLS